MLISIFPLLTELMSSGTIGLQEFVGLWGYLDQWKQLFRRFDADGSNAIDRKEFANALTAFGYRLSDKFINLLFASYDKKGEFPRGEAVALFASIDV
jgi:EF-hand domain